MLTRIEAYIRSASLPQRIYARMPSAFRAAALNARAVSLARLRYSPATMSLLDELMERDLWTRQRLDAHVRAEEESLLRSARRIPYYRAKASAVSAIGELPVLTRAEIKEHHTLMRDPSAGPLIRVFTSGSSGSGIPVCYDAGAYGLNWAYRMKHCLWAGVGPRDWRITFFGSRIIPVENGSPPFWMTNHVERQHLLSIFHIAERNAGDYVRFLDQHQGLVVEGFPTVLHLIARYVKGLRGRLSFRAVFSSGEPLYPSMRREIGEAFGARVFDAYGMTEWAGLVLECRHGGHHAMLDYGSLEILRDDGSAAAEGEEGDLVWSGFTNPAMPFIRYRIGDRGVWAGGKCGCGMPYPLVMPTVTRDSDYLVSPSGTVLSPRAINQVLKDKISFHSCQFIQRGPAEVVVRIVPVEGMDFSRDLSGVRKALSALLGGGVRIEEEVGSEPLRRGSRGKIPLIVSQSSGHIVRPAADDDIAGREHMK